MSKERFCISGEMLEVISYEENPDYREDMDTRVLTEDQDPTDTLDEFVVTVKFTVAGPLDLAALRLMAEGKHLFDMSSA